MFEGVPALIPFNYDEILIEEYTANALILTEYEGHRWNPATKVWDIAPDVPAGKEGEEMLLQQKSTRVTAKYSSVETGGFFYNLSRLIHWW